MTNHMRNICTLFWVVIHTISQAQIDVKATTETKALYKNLFALRNRGIMPEDRGRGRQGRDP